MITLEIDVMKSNKIQFFLFGWFVLTISIEYYASSSRIARFIEKSRKKGTQQRFYQTLGKKSFRSKVKTLNKNNSLTGSGQYNMNEIRKYFEEREPQTQAEILVGKMRDWWDLRNLTKEEETAVKEIIKVLRSGLTKQDFWFKNAAKLFEKYKSLSSNVVQKKLNELRTVITKEIHKKVTLLKDLKSKIKNKVIDDTQAHKLSNVFNNFSKQVRIAIEKIGIKFKGVDQVAVEELIAISDSGVEK